MLDLCGFLSYTINNKTNREILPMEFQLPPSQAGKMRIVQELVPGKQVTLAHVIAHPDDKLYGKLGLIDVSGAIGILTITPSEAAMIAADVATKAADVQIGFVDRFNGSVVVTGDVAAVEAALRDVIRVLCDMMGFSSAPITKT